MTSTATAATWLGSKPGLARRAASRLRVTRPGPDQKEQRHRHLRDDQTGAQSSARRRRAARRPVDDRDQIDPRALKRRNESEHERAPAGDQHREPDDEAVDADIEEDASRRRERLGVPDEQRDPAPREQDAEHRAGQGEDEVLDDQQTNDPRSRGAERQTHGDFAAARDPAHEHEPRDVRARDQQHQQTHRASGRSTSAAG